MSLIAPRILELGGSHAQRDLFNQIPMDSTIKTGRYVQAQQMLEQARGYDPLSVPRQSCVGGYLPAAGFAPSGGTRPARIAGDTACHRHTDSHVLP